MKVTKQQLLAEATRVFGEAALSVPHEQEYFGTWSCVLLFYVPGSRTRAELHGKGRSRNGCRRSLLTILQALSPLASSSVALRSAGPCAPDAQPSLA